MESRARSILITGANGFIGRNLRVHLNECENVTIKTFGRSDDSGLLPLLLSQVDAVVHLAGENRSEDESAFDRANVLLTEKLCTAVRSEFRATGRLVSLVLASSAHAVRDDAYGRSKLAAERLVTSLFKDIGNPVSILRLPGVFGKWCKPNYNSVVATFCHNIARDLPITVSDPNTRVKLVYIDDVVNTLMKVTENLESSCISVRVEPEYEVTLGELEKQIRTFVNFRSALITDRVGTGFLRALYATFLSYLPKERFADEVPQFGDSRGVFVEMLKTHDSGQFSYLTVYPGVTRGGHYHHTKSEKFLVVKGEALFRFRHLLTNEVVELRTRGGSPQVVDTIPGWTHDITNVGDDEMVVMLWANENFDREKPDTVASKV